MTFTVSNLLYKTKTHLHLVHSVQLIWNLCKFICKPFTCRLSGTVFLDVFQHIACSYPSTYDLRTHWWDIRSPTLSMYTSLRTFVLWRMMICILPSRSKDVTISNGCIEEKYLRALRLFNLDTSEILLHAITKSNVCVIT